MNKHTFDNLDPAHILVIYHGNCADGFGAAYAAWSKFGSAAQYVPYEYHMNARDIEVSGKEVIFLDVSFPRDVFLEVINKAHSVQLIDHHASAFETLGDLACCSFDMGHSGAQLAWKAFQPTRPVPDFINYIEDGDLWKFNYLQTKAFYAKLNDKFDYTFENWQQLENPEYLQQFVAEGAVLRAKFEAEVDSIVSTAQPLRFMGQDVFMVECSGDYTSDVGAKLAIQSGTFSLICSDKGDKFKGSMRSVNSFDSSLIASLFGGGGHPQANSFIANSRAEFMELLRHNQETPVPTQEEIRALNQQKFEEKVLKRKLF